MANIKGGRAARKRDRQNEKARKRNAVCKAKLHDAHKKSRQGREEGHHHEEHG